MPSKTPKTRVATPLPNGEIPKRKPLVLSCSKCTLELSTMAFEERWQGEGWPKHRCNREVRDFDQQRPDPFK